MIGSHEREPPQINEVEEIARDTAVEHADPLPGEEPVIKDQTALQCACKDEFQGVDEDGYCEGCGVRLQRPASDHREQQVSPHLAAVSDRGLVHRRNEDSFALAQGKRGYGLVVCDGVSSTRMPEVASELVARIMGEAFVRFLTSDAESAEATMREALSAAASALWEREREECRDDQSPSTTVVAALVVGQEVTLGWAGDSRAYWITDTEATALTRDHSLAVEEFSVEQADEAVAHAHTITRWLGADAGSRTEPEVVQQTLTAEGTLLLCSDGVWNYLEDAQEFFVELQRCLQGDTGSLSLARHLVAFANTRGGRDNATVAVLQVPAMYEADIATEAALEQTGGDDRKDRTGEGDVDSIQG